MTRLPAEAQRISYVPEDMDLPKLELPRQCAHPSCDFDKAHGHHIVRRSYTQGIGPQDYIQIDGEVVPNVVGLCFGHHQEVEMGRAHIEYFDEHFLWHDKSGNFVGQLNPVPLVQASHSPLESSTPADGMAGLNERAGKGEGQQTRERSHARAARSQAAEEQTATGYELSPAHSTAGDGGRSPAASTRGPLSANRESAPTISEQNFKPAPGEPCPTCNRKVPKPKAELEAERPKTTWAIKVPVDARENGYALLRDLVEQAREVLGRPEGTPPYFTLVEALYGFLTGAEKAA